MTSRRRAGLRGRMIRPLFALGRRRGTGARSERPFIPADPATLDSPLDPALGAIRAGLVAHQRSLWLRRAVRRAWLVAAVVAVAELGLAVAQRTWPLENAPLVAAALAVAGALALLVAVVLVRPSIGETALAVDAEARTGDAIASALAFAPSAPGPEPASDDADEATIAVGPSFDLAAAEARFVRRQRRDALARLRVVEGRLFRPRFAGRPAAIALLASVLLLPAMLLPNPQDLVIAQDRAVRAEAQKQAQRIDEVAKQLAAKGANANDPRTQLAQQLKQLAEKLRTNPGDLQSNLAQLGAVEDGVTAQLDPANEQRASALASVARALSRTATGDQQANPAGDPKVTHEDLKALASKLDTMTEAQRQAMASQLAGLQGQVSQADATAGQALKDAVSSLSQGDIAGAKAALDKLGQALQDAGDKVQVNRDLASAASNLQDARRNLANAGDQQSGQTGQAGQQGSGQQGNGQQGNGQQGNGQASGAPGASGSGQGQGGSPGPASSGSGQGQGGSPGASSGSGQGQGQGQGSGSLGGGGSNAAYLGSGMSNGTAKGPTNPNRPSVLGPDLSTVYAPFDRLGKPGDPSYVAGTGGDGQTQQGNQQGQGSNNGSSVPYQQVYGDFQQYALTTLDRSYVPISVKDYVRNYFSSLDPKQ